MIVINFPPPKALPLCGRCKSVLFALHSVNIDIDGVDFKPRSLFNGVSDLVDDALAYGGYVDPVGYYNVQVNNKTLSVLSHIDALVGEVTVLLKTERRPWRTLLLAMPATPKQEDAALPIRDAK